MNSGPIKTFWDTICYYITDHLKVDLHVYDTFYGSVTYHVLNLYVNCLELNLQEITNFKMVLLHSARVSW